MSLKTNKIIVLASLLIFAVLATYIILNREQIIGKLTLPSQDIKGVVTGPSYDALIPDLIALPNVSLWLQSTDDTSYLTQAITKNDGSFVFEDVPSHKTYLLTLDHSQAPASYYHSYQTKITASSGKNILNLPQIKLILTPHALRDLQRQRSLYLYQKLLNLYYQDHSSYPVSQDEEKITDNKSFLISSLTLYLETMDYSKDNLIDPIKDRPLIYSSDGEHYWLTAMPETILNTPLFNDNMHGYLISQ